MVGVGFIVNCQLATPPRPSQQVDLAVEVGEARDDGLDGRADGARQLAPAELGSLPHDVAQPAASVEASPHPPRGEE